MTEPDDQLTKLRIDVAEMRGMLQQALSDHGQRITNVERDNVAIHARLSDKAKALVSHTEKIGGLERAVNVLENDNRARRASIIGIGSLVVGAGGLALAILNRLTF